MAVKFDPGFAQHTTILSVNLEYIYADIARFKNFGQKKLQFKKYYPKILKLVENNVAFCLGCLLWAVYIKSLGTEEITNNPCLNNTYNEAEAVEEVDFSKEYFEQLKKDTKYYLGQNYDYNPQYINVFDTYREFLILNNGFVDTKTTEDLVIPESLKQPKNFESINNKIQDVIKTGNMTELFELYGTIL